MSAPSFALVAGLVYIVVGALGFAGSFPATKLLSGVYLLAGLWGCASWAGATSAVRYARSIAVFFGVLALLELVLSLSLLSLGPVSSAFFRLLPPGGPLVLLHAAAALLAAYFGFRSLARHAQKTERRHTPADRRHSARPVRNEQRRGIADRRFGAGTLAAG